MTTGSCRCAAVKFRADRLRLQKHIFTADKGDYYDIADGVPQS
ncbi:hypothetical protein SAMN05444007_104132 [Cribrihabitans marinus]|jgi:hypothetical protein|uniref:Uncharacterized protein n=1 Tax=Cribrihabitans marinus TaxID=1227549 RepID=A0A1H6XNE9_9RHOB|nr:hypothetical protein [Cribrihabitans marinus]GGH27758.1 hypothetical protein GCM10010973_16250 [Cribrihabitans marinus]SEJ30599.1 hypothetical protein SAMN05444007_104132 [Cribrihabitans marinus]